MVPTGVFRPIGNGQVWLYHHPGYALPMLDCGTVCNSTEMESITCVCCPHDEFQLYFYDNPKLLQLFCSQFANNEKRF